VVTLPGIGDQLGARLDGAALLLIRDGRSIRVEVRQRRGWSFTVAAPALDGLRLRATLGAPTLLASDQPGAATVTDAGWRLTTNDPYRAARLLAEPPWPVDDVAHQAFGASLLAAAGDRGRTGRASPTLPLFELVVARGTATIRQHAGAVELAHAIGAARRVVQLVTRPTRLDDEAVALRRVAVPYR
jgi:hypothetical protein